MKKLICLSLVLSVLATSLLLTYVSGSTTVNGDIDNNTLWDKTSSPYILTGNIIVRNNASLTIEPGVTIDLSQYSIQVNGTLNARGQSGDNILFVSSYFRDGHIDFLAGSQSWDERSGSGCIIENAALSKVYLNVNGTVKIAHNVFNATSNPPVFVTGGSPVITHNLFTITSSGLAVTGGSSVISDNSMMGNGMQYGITITSLGTANISNNSISACQIGIGVYSPANINIQGNLVINSYYGIVNYATSNNIQNNVIAGNSVGISGTGLIQSNTISKNRIGIQTPFATIRNNNIYENSQNNIASSSANTIDATNNWWGTIDVAAINRTILDSKTSVSGTGEVSFIPFLPQPNPLAPALPNIVLTPPTPSPTPHPFYPSVNPSRTLSPADTPTLPPVESPIPTETPLPTPTPTPKATPGSPLVFGAASFGEALSQFDIFTLAELVLIGLGIVWLIVILVSIQQRFSKSDRSPMSREE